VVVAGTGPSGDAAAAVAAAKRSLLDWHERFTRFTPTSELSRLNADPRAEVPVSALLGRLVEASREAAERTGGLVDATLLDDLEDAGYRSDLGAPVPLALALLLAPRRRPAGASRAAHWREIEYDRSTGTVRRPSGVTIDSGGLAKGLFADVLAHALAGHEAFGVDCAGDLRLGGTAGLVREIAVASPLGRGTLHTFALAGGGVATSGIGRRSWLNASGAPAHHLLDPATGQPAFTGVIQATALAPTALEAEIRAKAALLSGPDRARAWLPDGGVVVLDDGSFEVIEEPGADYVAPGAGRAVAGGV
jgi:thiamine biosynthesis lipoprotein